jgi:hypothetical protein
MEEQISQQTKKSKTENLSYLDSVECVVLLIHKVARLSGVSYPVRRNNAEHVPCSEHCLEVLQPSAAANNKDN